MSLLLLFEDDEEGPEPPPTVHGLRAIGVGAHRQGGRAVGMARAGGRGVGIKKAGRILGVLLALAFTVSCAALVP